MVLAFRQNGINLNSRNLNKQLDKLDTGLARLIILKLLPVNPYPDILKSVGDTVLVPTNR
jgi:hypothetical protein